MLAASRGSRAAVPAGAQRKQAACTGYCQTLASATSSARPALRLMNSREAGLQMSARARFSKNSPTWVVKVASEVDTERLSTGKPVQPPVVAPSANKRDPLAYAALFGVALLWGSYTPAIKVIYAIDNPPDPPLMNALQACLSAVFLITANVTASLTDGKMTPRPERLNPMMAEDSAVREAVMQRDDAADREALQAATAVCASDDEECLLQASQPARRPASNPVEHAIAEALNWRADTIVTAGAEVGLWMCLAFGFEVAGVQLTSATKAAFLNQVSVLITPVLVHLSGEHVRGVEWLACALGLIGSALVGADSFAHGGGEGVGEPGMEGVAGEGNEVLGLIFVLVSALFFALSTVRLGRYSSMFNPLALSTASTTSLGLLSITWVVASIWGRPDGIAAERAVLDGIMADPTVLAVLLWVGLGPGALAAFLQAVGQKSVPPAQAQVIYSTTPLWAAGLALLVLDASDEAMGSMAWVGAAIMLTSSLITAFVPAAPTGNVVALEAAGAGDVIPEEVKERQGLKDVI